MAGACKGASATWEYLGATGGEKVGKFKSSGLSDERNDICYGFTQKLRTSA